jgi:hypothetical protein
MTESSRKSYKVFCKQLEYKLWHDLDLCFESPCDRYVNCSIYFLSLEVCYVRENTYETER